MLRLSRDLGRSEAVGEAQTPIRCVVVDKELFHELSDDMELGQSHLSGPLEMWSPTNGLTCPAPPKPNS